MQEKDTVITDIASCCCYSPRKEPPLCINNN